MDRRHSEYFRTRNEPVETIHKEKKDVIWMKKETICGLICVWRMRGVDCKCQKPVNNHNEKTTKYVLERSLECVCFATFACILKNIICNIQSRDWAICSNSLLEVIYFLRTNKKYAEYNKGKLE